MVKTVRQALGLGFDHVGMGVLLSWVKKTRLSDGAAWLYVYLLSESYLRYERLLYDKQIRKLTEEEKQDLKMMRKGYYPYSTTKVHKDLGKKYNWQRRCFKELVETGLISTCRIGVASRRMIRFLHEEKR